MHYVPFYPGTLERVEVSLGAEVLVRIDLIPEVEHAVHISN